jgi:cullin 3
VLLFLNEIIRPPISKHLILAILDQIHIERDNFAVNRSALKECVAVLRQLREADGSPSIYERDLEPAVLKESEAYYKTEADTLLDTCDASEYLQRVRTDVCCRS